MASDLLGMRLISLVVGVRSRYLFFLDFACWSRREAIGRVIFSISILVFCHEHYSPAIEV